MKLEPKESKHITEAGVIKSASASSVTTFDERTPFGCQRKWWFENKADLRGPQDTATALGDEIHKQIEHYCTTREDVLGKEARAGKKLIDAILARNPYFQIEQWIPSGFEVAAVPFKGRLDFIGRDYIEGQISEIIDWKSTSSIERYGKLPSQLLRDPQVLVYRQWAEQAGCLETLPVSLVYFGTKKREAEQVTVKLSRQMLADGMGDLNKTVDSMKEVAKILDSEEVKPDWSKCDVGRGCPFKLNCLERGKGASMASLMANLRKSVAPAEPAPVPPAAPSALPPDAPKSAAPVTVEQIAAARKKLEIPDTVIPAPAHEYEKPAETAPVSEAPKKPGRPPGAKNKPKDPQNTEGQAPAPLATNEKQVTLTEVTVAHGTTINMGDFNSHRIDLSATVRCVGEDFDKVRGELSAKVKAALLQEMEAFVSGAKK